MASDVAQLEELLLGLSEALGSIPSTAKRKRDR